MTIHTWPRQALLVALASAFGGGVMAQTPPAFDVASVKETVSSRTPPRYVITPGGRFASVTCAPPAPPAGVSPAARPPDASCGGITGTFAGGLVATAAPLMMLASMLSSLPGIDRPVEDRTQLSGAFDFSFEPEGTLTDAPAERGANVMTALREQLGLELKPATGTRRILVVEQIDRPTPN